MRYIVNPITGDLIPVATSFNNSSGNSSLTPPVGIGTDTPGADLHVAGSLAVTSSETPVDDPGSGNAYIQGSLSTEGLVYSKTGFFVRAEGINPEYRNNFLCDLVSSVGAGYYSSGEGQLHYFQINSKVALRFSLYNPYSLLAILYIPILRDPNVDSGEIKIEVYASTDGDRLPIELKSAAPIIVKVSDLQVKEENSYPVDRIVALKMPPADFISEEGWIVIEKLGISGNIYLAGNEGRFDVDARSYLTWNNDSWVQIANRVGIFTLFTAAAKAARLYSQFTTCLDATSVFSTAIKVAGEPAIDLTGGMQLRGVFLESTPILYTTDGSESELEIEYISPTNGVQRKKIFIPPISTWFFEVDIVARRLNLLPSKSAAFKLKGIISREAAKSSTQIHSGLVKEAYIESLNGATWDCNAEANTLDGALRIKIQGEVGAHIKWQAFMKFLRVTEEV